MFKKIFGSEQSQDIPIGFLNALLYNGDRTIKHLEILNPYLAPRIRGIKDTYLDVKATLEHDKIELEVAIAELDRGVNFER